ncbi:sensor histidine kinase [Streptomyces sp. Amel2xB2]|uniref:sensor histidine kinase n=1 Tax=Streptomyces sp. Amel2xB2 TaxID=1305829 RepID=UPI000DB9DB8E|nr:sensor histidine kinase [Streptomyces sp. Amel2xB2]
MTETGETRTVGGPWWWTRRRSAALDIALGLCSAAECAVQGVNFADEAGLPTPAGVLLGLAAGSVLVLRRRWPIAVVLVSIALSPAEMGFLLGFVGLYSLAVASGVPRRITVVLSAMQAVAVVIVLLVRLHQSVGQDPGFDPPAWFIPAISVLIAIGVTAPPVLMGLYVGARRRLVESLRERADGLERELALLADRAEERAEWARSEERTRIAREMHDVVAHRVSLMVVHAAALQAVALKDPEKAAKNAALVGDMGRQALNELRTMLGVLRSPERAQEPGSERAKGPEGSGSARGVGGEVRGGGGAGTAAGAGGASVRLAEFAVAAAAGSARDGANERPAGSADTDTDTDTGSAVDGAAADAEVGAGAAGTPGETDRTSRTDGAAEGSAGDGPSLSELDVLVGQSREAGMVVELSVDGASRGYAAGVEQTAFRVVQEALTNVHKHAPGARTRVRLAHREGEVAVQVENECPEDGAGAAGAGLPSGGNGLVGMQERVTALGGGFVSGPTEVGGFRVSAVIPARRREPDPR